MKKKKTFFDLRVWSVHLESRPRSVIPSIFSSHRHSCFKAFELHSHRKVGESIWRWKSKRGRRRVYTYRLSPFGKSILSPVSFSATSRGCIPITFVTWRTVALETIRFKCESSKSMLLYFWWPFSCFHASRHSVSLSRNTYDAVIQSIHIKLGKIDNNNDAGPLEHHVRCVTWNIEKRFIFEVRLAAERDGDTRFDFQARQTIFPAHSVAGDKNLY